jgi:hypothetical protein
VFKEIRSEIRALIYFMIGVTFLGLGLLLGQVAFTINLLAGP